METNVLNIAVILTSSVNGFHPRPPHEYLHLDPCNISANQPNPPKLVQLPDASNVQLKSNVHIARKKVSNFALSGLSQLLNKV